MADTSGEFQATPTAEPLSVPTPTSTPDTAAPSGSPQPTAPVAGTTGSAAPGTGPAAATAPPAAPRPATKASRLRAPRPEFGKTISRGAAAASSKLTPLVVRAGDTVVAASPLTLVQFGLGFLLTVSVIAAVSFDNTLGIAATILFVPVLAAALGALGMRSFDNRRRDRAQREETQTQDHAARNLERTLDYIDAKLTTAMDRFGTDRHNDAVIAMFQAKAATELCLGPVPPGPSRDPQASEAARLSTDRPSLADFLTPSALTGGERTEGVGRLLI